MDKQGAIDKGVKFRSLFGKDSLKRSFWLAATLVFLSLLIVGVMWISIGVQGLEVGIKLALMLIALFFVLAFGLWVIWQVYKAVGSGMVWLFSTIERLAGLPVAHWGKLFEHLPKEQIDAKKIYD